MADLNPIQTENYRNGRYYPRPIVFNYEHVVDYLRAMIEWLRLTDREFSIRRATRNLHRCSPSLVTQVLKGNRKLTSDRVEAFSKLLRLTVEEKNYLTRWVGLDEGHTDFAVELPPEGRVVRKSSDHILSDWLHAYVKDSARLRGFKPEPKVIHRILGGIASVNRIQRSLKFLFREGFLRRTLDGKVVENEVLVTTSDEIPNEKLKAFHKQGLEIAKRALFLYPIEMRQASTLVLPLNESTRQELKQILKEFYSNLLDFAEKHSDDSEQLYQVVVNLCPIGGLPNEKK